MGTIVEELQALAANKSAIKAAIEAKNPTVMPGEDMGNWPTSIESIPTNRKADENDVMFIDYDGTILYSYSAEEVANMTQLPPLPTQPGLTCQGWNWTLQQIKNYVASYGKCHIGATYTTDDGKTRITLTIQDPKYSNIPIIFQQTVANGVEVNWGDGSTIETYASTSQQTITHQYSPTQYPATYTITFNIINGTMSFPAQIMGKKSINDTSDVVSSWTNMIEIVHIGRNVTSIGGGSVAFNGTFQSCHSLKYITIPSGVSIGRDVFMNCYSLVFVTLPSTLTSIGVQLFGSCFSLQIISIPSNVTSINVYAFSGSGLNSTVIIPTNVHSLDGSVFSGCRSLKQVIIPSTVTELGLRLFQTCNSLTSITIPNNATLSAGGENFSYCRSLTTISLPSSVTNIPSQCFSGCIGLTTFDFRRSTSVPTLYNVNAFLHTPTEKEIIVPDELYDDWIAATNWSSTTNNIVGSIVKASESSLGPLA